jgi:hypothetical protein
MSIPHEIGAIGQEARGIVRRSGRGIAILARAGFAAKGIVYLLVGGMAAMAAVGAARIQDEKGVLRELHHQPFGKVLLGLMIVGLAGYALFRGVQAVLNPEHEARGLKGVGLRIGWGVSAIAHVALLVFATTMLLGSDDGGGKGDARALTARLMAWEPAGVWIVGAGGAILAAVGVGQLYLGIKAKLDKQLDLSRLRRAARKFVVTFSRIGLAARGIVFMGTGGFVLYAALTNDPSEAKGLGETLEALGRQSYGWILLGLLAIGLVAYGLYQLIEAQYRRIKPA